MTENARRAPAEGNASAMRPLFFEDNGSWVPLPDWAQFFVDVGSSVGVAKPGDHRLVIGISVPTRAYAAAFSALGVVTARSALQDEVMSPEEHFRFLCSRPVGAAVTFEDGVRLKNGEFAGCAEVEGEKRIKVRLSNAKGGNLTRFIPARDSLRIRIDSRRTRRKLPKDQSGHLIVPNVSFLRALLGMEAGEFVMNSRLECVIVGPSTVLRAEITQTRLAVCDGPSDSQLGTLQDVLRVRQFLAEGAPYRSEVLTASGDEPQPRSVTGCEPQSAVFDGAIAFLKWRDVFTRSHWIAILDRTEHRFPDAVAAISERFAQRASGDMEETELPPVSRGMELVAFLEERS